MNKKDCIFILIKMFAVCASLTFVIGCNLLDNLPIDEKIELSGNPSKIVFQTNESIVINLILKNKSTKTVFISNWVLSSFEIKSLKKDGLDVFTQVTKVTSTRNSKRC